MYIKKQPAYLAVNPNKVDSLIDLFDRTPVGRGLDSMIAPFKDYSFR